jgi:hypothetical protein
MLAFSFILLTVGKKTTMARMTMFVFSRSVLLTKE